jgi:hypothetical protein
MAKGAIDYTGATTMSITFHHYGATVLNMPISQVRFNLQAILRMPFELVNGAEHATADLEEASDGLASTHTLTYRAATCAVAVAEYTAACTLRPVADAPHTTFFEWTRVYRFATPAGQDQISPFVSAMVGQDRAIAARLAVEYAGAEVLYMDYTIGAAGDQRVYDAPALRHGARRDHRAGPRYGRQYPRGWARA